MTLSDRTPPNELAVRLAELGRLFTEAVDQATLTPTHLHSIEGDTMRPINQAPACICGPDRHESPIFTTGLFALCTDVRIERRVGDQQSLDAAWQRVADHLTDVGRPCQLDAYRAALVEGP